MVDRMPGRALGSVVAFMLMLPMAPSGGGELVLASTRQDGVKGRGPSSSPSLSADGTIVAFSSRARNLDAADRDDLNDVYVKNLLTGQLTLASVSTAGLKGDGNSTVPSLSADGTKVAFESDAGNLHPVDTDTLADVFVKDLVTGELILASSSGSGAAANGFNRRPVLSLDGTKLAFYSTARNLHPSDTDSYWDVYLKDLVTGEVTLVSTNADGEKGNNHSGEIVYEPSLSADATRVAFESKATNLVPQDNNPLYDVYVKDLITGDLTLASITAEGLKGDEASLDAFVSSDGNRVVFKTWAGNFNPGDQDHLSDLYLKNLQTGELELVSTSRLGAKGNDDSMDPSLSADSTLLVFASSASNLVRADRNQDTDVFVKDLATGAVSLASTSDEGNQGNQGSAKPSPSSDATAIAFESAATNLDPADQTIRLDVYVKELPLVGVA